MTRSLGLFLVLLCSPCCHAEWALLNLIRHGERSQNSSDIHLTREGKERSAYIAKCVGSGVPSLAFPLGPPTQMIASFRPDESSVRPYETLQPLAERLGGMKIDNHIGMADAEKVAEYVQELPGGGTLFIAWQHWYIPFLVRALEKTATELAPTYWPTTCPYHEWEEPAYTAKLKPSKHNPTTELACYDVLWQVILFREGPGHSWRSQAFTQMHMGYGGSADAPCSSGFYPHSNPTHWKDASNSASHFTAANTDLAGWHTRASGLDNYPHHTSISSVPSSGFSLEAVLALLASATLLASFSVASAYEGPAHLASRLSLRLFGPRGGSTETCEPPMSMQLGEGLLDGTPKPGAGSRLSRPSLALAAAGTVVILMCAAGVTSNTISTATSATIVLAASMKGNSEMWHFWFDFFAGGFAGALAKTVSAPIERVKLLIQTQDKIPAIVSGEMPRYRGIIDCFWRVATEQGCMSFWRGNLPNVLRYFPVAAFNFAFNDMIRGWFPHYNPHTQFAAFLCVNLISGGLAGAGSLTIVYPLDYARTRLAADVGGDRNSPMMKRAQPGQGREFEGLVDCVLKTVQKNGFLALYQGYVVSVIGIIAYRAPYFGLFDTFNALNPLAEGKKTSAGGYLLGVLSSFCIAQLTSAIAAVVSYPFDTVRRRLQMEASADKEDCLYRGMCHCAAVIIESEGFAALYKGFIANLFRGASTAFMLVLFNELTGIKGSA